MLIPPLSRSTLLTILSLCLASLALAGCQEMETTVENPAPVLALTPSTTPDNLGFYSVPSPACIIADWGSMQTDRPQGDLIAWSPDGAQLAYLAPQSSTSWYVGVVSVATGQAFDQHSELASNVMAIGDLTWSPDGSMLAFVALRTDESLNTVMVVRADTITLTDLFPFDQARSDQYTSDKSILGWSDSNHLQIVTSCEEDCQQEMVINVLTGEERSVGEAQRRNASQTPTPGVIKVLDGLAPQVNQQTYDPKNFPRVFDQPNWSPDGKSVIYLDRHGLLWNLNPENKAQYLLDIGLRNVNETKWSPDGQLVAVRAEDRIFVLNLACYGSAIP